MGFFYLLLVLGLSCVTAQDQTHTPFLVKGDAGTKFPEFCRKNTIGEFKCAQVLEKDECPKLGKLMECMGTNYELCEATQFDQVKDAYINYMNKHTKCIGPPKGSRKDKVACLNGDVFNVCRETEVDFNGCTITSSYIECLERKATFCETGYGARKMIPVVTKELNKPHTCLAPNFKPVNAKCNKFFGSPESETFLNRISVVDVNVKKCFTKNVVNKCLDWSSKFKCVADIAKYCQEDQRMNVITQVASHTEEYFKCRCFNDTSVEDDKVDACFNNLNADKETNYIDVFDCLGDLTACTREEITSHTCELPKMSVYILQKINDHVLSETKKHKDQQIAKFRQQLKKA